LIYKVLVEFKKDFVEVDDNLIKIGLMLRPVKGEANKEMVKKIAKHFAKSTSSIVIKSGHKSTTKIIEIL
tara:strand:- start:235 stop:444 length:210 start_codon:yes stop_codon:yes gene_type:complete